MICQFHKPLTGLFYNFRWYIENRLLTSAIFNGVAEEEINTTAVLRPEHWTSQHSMNMNVWGLTLVVLKSKTNYQYQ
jgi:hypothetical protein